MARHLRSVGLSLQEPSIPREYAAAIKVHLVTVQYLITDNESLNGAVSVDPARLSVAALDLIKARYVATWTFQAEIVLLAAKLYVIVKGLLCLSGEEPDERASRSPPLVGVLESADETARLIVALLSNLSEDKLDQDARPGFSESDPLPGYPKYYSCIAFFAATVILYCIDLMENATIPMQTEEARNALGKAYRLFTKCEEATEHKHAAYNLDAAIKNITRGRVWFRNMVRTRSAASLVYSLIWLGGVARRKEDDPEFSVEAAERWHLTSRARDDTLPEFPDRPNGDRWMDLGFCDDMSAGFFVYAVPEAYAFPLQSHLIG